MVAAVRIKAPKSAVAETVRAIVMAACGPVGSPVGDSLKLLVGTLAMSKIQQWFEIKADGGTDPAGDHWPDLKPETKAYQRRIPGYKRKKVGQKPFGLLTKAQQKVWDDAFRRAFARYVQRVDLKEAKRLAAQVAWNAAKRAGGKTLIGEHGSDKVQILRDTGILLSSLSPGSTAPGHEYRILRPEDSAVVVGTNVPYAEAHHVGKRPLWPDPERWPDSVWQGIANKVAESIAGYTVVLLTKGGANRGTV